MNLSPTRRRSGHRDLPLSRQHRAEVDEHRALTLQLVTPGGLAARRISTAPPGYLLAHTSSDLVRQCELLEPLPALGEVRTLLTPGRTAGTWHLDLATRDRPGLLAAFAGALAGAAIDVTRAVIATWSDGAALQALVLRSHRLPDATILGAALTASLHQPAHAGPVPDARIDFDERASSIYTACRVEASDRPGLLHAIATAIAATGTDIHAASVATRAERALDRFDLSRRDGGKLDVTDQQRIRSALHAGTA